MNLRSTILNSVVALAAGFALTASSLACTNLLVTKGASVDGSVMITYTCDGEFHPHLSYIPAGDHEPGTMYTITDWGGVVRGEIPQVAHTYAVVGLMNEHQLAISETTFGGRDELRNPDGMFHYWDLMQLALQRARTAREAITVMTDLVATHGYRSGGESFSIADPDEAWILEMIGPGPGGTGALWVARRIPDGCISGHANKARIGEVPTDDPENCIFAPNVVSFALEQGIYDPKSDGDFRFCDVYCPPTARNRRYAESRVWSLFRRAAPSLNLSPDYHRGVEDAEPYPLWVKPDEKINLANVMSLMRDHYEGTPWDMTQGLDAGPHGSPQRWRPMVWDVDDENYMWERPISTQQTGFSFISQSRDWLPDPIGGVLWYGLDDTDFTCWFPLYCGIDAIPESYTVGSLQQFSWDSAWWVFNFVSNFTQLRYDLMIVDVRAVQQSLEQQFLSLQPAVEQTALQLHKSDQELMVRYLTDYCVTHGELVAHLWKALGEHLLTKYNDGYVKDANGRPQEAGYTETWLRKVLQQHPEKFRVQDTDGADY